VKVGAWNGRGVNGLKRVAKHDHTAAAVRMSILSLGNGRDGTADFCTDL